jgi:hypothetical protein
MAMDAAVGDSASSRRLARRLLVATLMFLSNPGRGFRQQADPIPDAALKVPSDARLTFLRSLAPEFFSHVLSFLVAAIYRG